MASTANQSSKIHVCEYCKKSFAKEKNLIAHLCQPKRRWLQKDDKAVMLGFWAFQRFYKSIVKTRFTKVVICFFFFTTGA